MQLINKKEIFVDDLDKYFKDRKYRFILYFQSKSCIITNYYNFNF